nr:MAG TPA: nucelotide kinase [Caudoviricetes sp.]
MICKKDTGDGKAFWTACTASRVILPNGGGAERMPYEPTGWWLLNGDDEYKLKDDAIVIKERVDRFKSTVLGEERTTSSDSVSHPSYYAEGWSNGAEVIDLTEHLSFCAGNVVKYVCRAGRKDPDKYVEDLEKARWYLDREIARVKS